MNFRDALEYVVVHWTEQVNLDKKDDEEPF